MRFYTAVAFFSGLVVLTVEITAFRIVAPFFGNSIFITTNLLGVILAGLAVGYWVGGRYADRYPSARPLYFIMLATALLIGAIPFVAPPLFGALRGMIVGLDWTLIALSLLGSFLIFFIPFVFLGMVAPWLIRVANKEVGTTGRTAGRLYAWSTIGSLLGTFIPTWLTVPLLGSKKTILLFAGVLALVAGLGLLRRRWLVPGTGLLVAMLMVQPAYFSANPNIVAERESSVEYLRVVREADASVRLEQDEGFGTHSVYHPDYYTTGQVFDWFSLAPALLEKSAASQELEPLSLGIIGLAGGTAARQYEHFFGPEGEDPHTLSMRGVEVDRTTLELAEQYFGLNQQEVPSLEAEVGDGRVWLLQQEEPFDILIVDAFRQLYIPPHLSSQEFFEITQDKLSPGGVLVVNLNVTDIDSVVYQKMAATLRDVFPEVLTVQVPNSYNVLFFASDRSMDPEQVADRNKIKDLQPIADQFTGSAQLVAEAANDWLIATDDRPLVESMFDTMVARYLLNIDAN